MDLYKIESIQMVIEFLSRKVKSTILRYIFPLNVLQMYFFSATIFLNEMHLLSN